MSSWVVSVRWWQWVAMAVVVGCLLGWSRRASLADVRSHGETLKDQKRFEIGLLPQAMRHTPHVKDVGVYAASLPGTDGHARPVHVVTLKFFWGRPRWDATLNAEVADYRPMVFVAEVPYRPRNLDALLAERPDSNPAVEAFRRLPEPTVLDYLALVRQARGVSYTHRWWNDSPMLTCVIASVVLVGVVWPAVINLIVFGRLIRPREEKAQSLLGVSTASATSTSPAAPLRSGRLDDELDGVIGEPLAGVDAPPARELSKQPAADEAPVTAAAAAAKAFGAEQDDFYPTEQKARRTSRH